MSLLEHWPVLLTLQEAAEILRADPATVSSFIQAGKITCTEIAGKPLIPRTFLENFIEKSCKVCNNEDIEMREVYPILWVQFNICKAPSPKPVAAQRVEGP